MLFVLKMGSVLCEGILGLPAAVAPFVVLLAGRDVLVAVAVAPVVELLEAVDEVEFDEEGRLVFVLAEVVAGLLPVSMTSSSDSFSISTSESSPLSI